ncbi:MAG: hypothetical protein LBJ10_08925 [Clostridiales bacterium]|jgi:hypothetical protein|nr:hypothetical protein [Clostridiales bacterium]
MAAKNGNEGGRGAGRFFAKSGRGGGGGRISNAEFAIVAVLLLALEGILLANFLIAPLKRQYDEEKTRLSGYVFMREGIERTKQNTEQRQAYLAELDAKLAEQGALLPPALHNEDISLEISAYAQAHNITLESVAFAQRELVNPAEYVAAAGGAGTGSAATGSAATGSAATGSAAAGGAGAAGATGTAGATGVAGAAGAAEAAGAAGGGAGENAAAAKSGAGAIESAIAEAELIANGLGGLSGAPQASGGGGAKTMSVQSVLVSFVSEAHTIGGFLRAVEEGAGNARIKTLTAAREQEGVIKGAIGLEYVSLSADAEAAESGMYAPQPHGSKESLFQKYEGYVEEGVDPTILLVSSEDDIDPNFYMILNQSSSNDTKITLGVFPRTETAIYFNANNAARAKLSISGDADQLEYTYTLGTSARTERRRLEAVDGKLRLDVISHPLADDDDKVAILLDVENGTGIPLEIRVRNDDVLNPRFHLGETSGDVSVRP